MDWYINSRLNETRLPIALEVGGLSQRRPAPVIETALFRIAQEALSNVTKHARATSARVKLDFGKSLLVLEVEDDGRGFDTNAGFRISGDKQNLGLLGMMERAKLCGGSLKVDSAPGRGTRLRVEIPVGSYDWGAY
ncbi:ATP-binding protein [Dehalococcoidia bacterium]|nr:ATP-binding protein [Dehalococcoidia bacterium]